MGNDPDAIVSARDFNPFALTVEDLVTNAIKEDAGRLVYKFGDVDNPNNVVSVVVSVGPDSVENMDHVMALDEELSGTTEVQQLRGREATEWLGS